MQKIVLSSDDAPVGTFVKADTDLLDLVNPTVKLDTNAEIVRLGIAVGIGYFLAKKFG